MSPNPLEQFSPVTGLVGICLLAVLCATVASGKAIAAGPGEAVASPSRAPRQSMAVAASVPRPADGGASVRIADGAYPVYYSVARSNGRFGKRIRAYGIGEYDQMQQHGSSSSSSTSAPVAAVTAQTAHTATADIRQ